MKTRARGLLAILLSFVLLFGSGLPASAARDIPAPVFTENLPLAIMIKADRSITLDAAARLPEGVTAELKYQWYGFEVESFPTPEELEALTREDLERLDYTPIEGADGQAYIVDSRENQLYATAYCVEAYYETEDGAVASSRDYVLLIHWVSFFSMFKEIDGSLSGALMGFLAMLPYSLVILLASVAQYLQFRRVIKTLASRAA